MTHTTLDHRERTCGDPLEFTGHEALAEQFRAALKGTPEPAQPNPEPSDA